jgi:D-hydroxyproline dehydrogenase subunit beta
MAGSWRPAELLADAGRHGLTGMVTAVTVVGVALGATADQPVDLVVVGAGVMGLAHALEAMRRGLSVVVLERDQRAVGASIQNFGHGCVTAQMGHTLECALAARRTWASLASEIGFWFSEAGAVVVARSDEEMAVLHQFAERRDGAVRVVGRRELLGSAPVGDERVRGGAHLRADVRVDPREAVRAIASWLDDRRGVDVRFSTNVLGIEPDRVRTNRGDVHCRRTVVCVGHDVDRLYPDVAEQAGVRRCSLHMLAVAAPPGRRFGPAVMTGSSMLRYPGFRELPATAELRTRVLLESPEIVDLGVNLMFTQRPNGDLVVGDTHAYGRTIEPFSQEPVDDLVLREIRRLLGVDRIVVKERWQGQYAAGPQEFLVAAPMVDTRIVSATTGIGMTTAFGLAPRVLDDLLEPTRTHREPARPHRVPGNGADRGRALAVDRGAREDAPSEEDRRERHPTVPEAIKEIHHGHHHARPPGTAAG